MTNPYDLVVRYSKAASPTAVLRALLDTWRDRAYPVLLVRLGKGPWLPITEAPTEAIEQRLSFGSREDVYLRLRSGGRPNLEVQLSFVNPAYAYPEPSSFLALQMPGDVVDKRVKGFQTSDLAELLLRLANAPGAVSGYVERQSVVREMADVRYRSGVLPELYWLTLAVAGSVALPNEGALIEVLKSSGGTRVLATENEPPGDLATHTARLRELCGVAE